MTKRRYVSRLLLNFNETLPKIRNLMSFFLLTNFFYSTETFIYDEQQHWFYFAIFLFLFYHTTPSFAHDYDYDDVLKKKKNEKKIISIIVKNEKSSKLFWQGLIEKFTYFKSSLMLARRASYLRMTRKTNENKKQINIIV